MTTLHPTTRRLCAQRIGQIIALVAADYGYTPDDLTCRARPVELVEARHVAMFFARVLTAYPLMMIGHEFARHHGAIMHACDQVRARIATEPEFAARVARLRAAAKTDLEAVAR